MSLDKADDLSPKLIEMSKTMEDEPISLKPGDDLRA